MAYNPDNFVDVKVEAEDLKAYLADYINFYRFYHHNQDPKQVIVMLADEVNGIPVKYINPPEKESTEEFTPIDRTPSPAKETPPILPEILEPVPA